MGKTIAITPSWYWPVGVPRVLGVPPFHVHEMLVERFARHRPDDEAVVAADGRFTARELFQRVEEAAAALAARAPRGEAVALTAGRTTEGVVLLFAALRAGVPVVVVDPESDGPVPGQVALALADEAGAQRASAFGVPVVRLADLAGPGEGTLPPSAAGMSDPVVGIASNGGVVWHSHQSLLAGAFSLGAFLGVASGRPWLSTFTAGSWEGVYGITVPLLAQTTLALAEPGEPSLQAATREGVGTIFTTLESAVSATRDAKRDVKSIRGLLGSLVLPTPGLFDPDERRRVSRQFECPALTVFGATETGPIFAAHPSWYLDESIGIPITNAHVVPVDPRSRRPLQTLWELVESAMVTVWSPALTVEPPEDRIVDGRFVTGVNASSDANGMIYLLPD